MQKVLLQLVNVNFSLAIKPIVPTVLVLIVMFVPITNTTAKTVTCTNSTSTKALPKSNAVRVDPIAIICDYVKLYNLSLIKFTFSTVRKDKSPFS
jgi:hypothetical protein